MRTTVIHAADRAFDAGLGVAEATAGRFGAHVVRAVPGAHPAPRWHRHELEFRLDWAVRGWVRFEHEAIGEVTLEAGSSAPLLPRVKHRANAHGDELGLVGIAAPAGFANHLAE